MKRPWWRDEIGAILLVSFCYGTVLSFFMGLVIALCLVLSGSRLAEALEQVNPALGLLSRDTLIKLALLAVWPLSFALVYRARWSKAHTRGKGPE